MTPAPGGESSLRGQWFIQMGLESLTEEAASKQEFQGWAAIFPDRSGRFGGRWNLLGGDKHLGKARGQGMGGRKKGLAGHTATAGSWGPERPARVLGCWTIYKTAGWKGGQEAGRETRLQKRPPEHGLGWRDQMETQYWGGVHSTQPGALWEAGCESFLGGTRMLPTSQMTNSSPSGVRNLLAAPLGSTFCSAPCHILAQGSLERNASSSSSLCPKGKSEPQKVRSACSSSDGETKAQEGHNGYLPCTSGLSLICKMQSPALWPNLSQLRLPSSLSPVGRT